MDKGGECERRDMVKEVGVVLQEWQEHCHLSTSFAAKEADTSTFLFLIPAIYTTDKNKYKQYVIL